MTFIPMQGKCPHCGRDDCMPELTTLNKRIAELEAENRQYKTVAENYKDRFIESSKSNAAYRTENQRLRDKVADWQNRLTEGLQYDSENNQTILVWTQREIDQAKSEADELCRKLGIPLEKEG